MTDPITISRFQILISLISLLSAGIGAWLYRHERWFSNIVFPVIQALTGRSPRGEKVNRTDKGHFQETENRLQTIEDEVESLRDDMNDVKNRQIQQNKEIMICLYQFGEQLEEIDTNEIPDLSFDDEDWD